MGAGARAIAPHVEGRVMSRPIEIRTTKFEFSHGRIPRGRGGWAFIVMDGRKEIETIWAPVMNFSDAKVWIKAWVRKNCADFIRYTHLEVGP